MSNNSSVELNLDPPMQEEGPMMKLNETGFVIPVIYPFGTIYIVFEF
jgi:hypothetical protein